MILEKFISLRSGLQYKVHKSAYHLFLLFISKRVFSALQTRKSFSDILSGNHRFLRPGIKVVVPYNSAYFVYILLV